MAKVIITTDLDKQALRDEYQNAISTLQQIEAATNPTNAQVIAAIKAIARIVRLMLRFFAKNL